MRKKRDFVTYHDAHPSHLATAHDLEAAGLQPSRDQLPAALFKYKFRDGEGTCALYERSLCVPREQKAS